MHADRMVVVAEVEEVEEEEVVEQKMNTYHQCMRQGLKNYILIFGYLLAV